MKRFTAMGLLVVVAVFIGVAVPAHDVGWTPEVAAPIDWPHAREVVDRRLLIPLRKRAAASTAALRHSLFSRAAPTRRYPREQFSYEVVAIGDDLRGLIRIRKGVDDPATFAFEIDLDEAEVVVNVNDRNLPAAAWLEWIDRPAPTTGGG